MTSIEMAIRTRLDVIFSKYTPNVQLTEFKEELVADLLDAYQDFAKQDKSHEEALDDTFSQLGDIDKILQDMSQSHTNQTADDETGQANQTNFFDFSDDGLRLGNLHINGQGVRLGDDIILDGKNDKVQFGDWLHVDRSGARLGRKFYSFDTDDSATDFTAHKQANVPHWTAAHHNVQLPLSDKLLAFNYKNATLNFYRNDKADLITIDEFFSRDNQRYFATISETDDQLVVSQGDTPLLFQVRVQVNVGLPKNFTQGQITVTNRSGRTTAQDLILNTFNLTMTAGSFSGQHIQAKSAIWTFQSSDVSVQDVSLDTAKIFNKSGRIKLDHATIPQSQISLTSGVIQVEHFIGGGQFSTTSGTLRLKVDQLTQDLKLRAVSSAVRLTTPDTQDFHFDLSSQSGAVTINRPQNAHFDRNTTQEKRGFYGEQPEFTIDASVDSGTIKVY